ncbi:MAG: hypothetical protein ACRDK9_00090 [Solirubrobacterales bacterium]
MTKHRLGGVRSAVAGLAAIGLLVAAPAAVAQQIGPTDDQYESTLEVISQGERPDPPPSGGPGDGGAPDGPSATADETVAGLPFTGLEVGGMLAAALALGGAGLLLRRLARERSATGGGMS